MARIRGHRALDLGKPLFVKREGSTTRGYKAGDVYPWRDLGVSERRVRQLHDQRWLGHEQPGERNGAELPARSFSKHPAPVVAAAAKSPAPSPKQPRR